MISVVIPLYNKAHTIVDTLQTVLNQTYNDFEIIIVNDGSTDNGVEVIYQNFSDKRIHIINQENQGVSAARNKGAAEAKGAYIAFLDGDDEWHPEYLENVYYAIRKYPKAGMICTGGLICDKRDATKVGYRLANKYIGKVSQINYFENPSVFGHTSGTTIKKEKFSQTCGFPIKMKCCEDYACTQTIALISKVVYIGLPLSKYNGGVEGQITSIDSETRFKLLESVVEYYNTVMNIYSTENINNKICQVYLKYDIRHRFKGFLLGRNWKSLDYLYDNLNEKTLSILFDFEKRMYRNKYRILSVAWINFTKIIWRLHKYPIVGEKVNINKIPVQYRKW